MTIKNYDSEISALIAKEEQRQKTTINLIASENYVSPAIRETTASVLTNKYAEGYPGKRYYSGCSLIDQVERIAIERAQQLFSAEHANVQPHAGSQANMAVYFSVLQPEDTIMGMSLSEGGHLTHGHTVNFSGTLYKSAPYTVNRETEQLDYDEIEKLAEQHKPKIIIAGASAYSRTIDFQRFATIAHNVGAFLLADIAHIAGLIAANIHPSPISHADFVTSTTHKTLRGPRGGFVLCKKELASKIDRAIMPGMQGGPFMHIIAAKAVAFKEAMSPSFSEYQKQIVTNAQTMATEFKNLGYRIVSGGTDNHLFVLDLRNKNITGLAAERLLESIGITVSRSCIPFDPEKPWISSGIRIGTPAITTRGLNEQEAQKIVHIIDEALKNKDNQKKLKAITIEIQQIIQGLAKK